MPTIPDPPLNLAEDVLLRSKSTLGLTWSNAEYIGSDAIIDYRISIAQSDGSYSVLASNVLSASYQATGLSAGVTYLFKIESRNSYGYSALSDSTSIYCAYKPDPPLTITTLNFGN